MTSRCQIIYWRDIPAQVKVRAASARTARSLSERFQQAIDEAAMREGLIGTEEYLSMWRPSEWFEREGPPDEVASALVAELETGFPPDRLAEMVGRGGRSS